MALNDPHAKPPDTALDVPFERRADSVRLEHLVPIDRLTTLPAALSGNTGTNRETRAVRQIEANPVHDLRRGSAHWN